MKQHGDEECPLRARANINVTQVDEDILAQLLRQSPTVNATFDELDLPSPADDAQDGTKRRHATLAYMHSTKGCALKTCRGKKCTIPPLELMDGSTISP